MTKPKQVIRLLSLIAFLSNPPVDRRAGWTRQELLDNIDGYDSGESGTRQFNRDLRAIRELGKEVIEVPVELSNTLAYRIEIADQPYLSAAEAEVVAALVSNSANPVLAQLRVRLAAGTNAGSENDSLSSLGIPIPVNVDVVINAIASLSVLHFCYRGLADSQARERKVEPYRVYDENGIWYFAGRDRSDGIVKYFRFDRCEGEIRAVGRNAFPRPHAKIAGIYESTDAVAPLICYAPQLESQISDLGGVPRTRDAEPEAAAGACSPGWLVAQLPARPVEVWKRLLLGCGKDLVVIHPLELRAAIKAQVKLLAAQLAELAGEEVADG